jgi:hypothetical protein
MNKKAQDEQFRRFVETARELGCDEDKERFEEKLKRIAKATTPKRTPKTARPKGRS